MFFLGAPTCWVLCSTYPLVILGWSKNEQRCMPQGVFMWVGQLSGGGGAFVRDIRRASADATWTCAKHKIKKNQKSTYPRIMSILVHTCQDTQ